MEFLELPHFGYIGESNPQAPRYYWNTVSQEQRWKWICINHDKLVKFVNALVIAYNDTDDDVKELQRLFQKFQESGFDDYYKQSLLDWMDKNIEILYEHLATMVFFGLTDDGYFCAYIPDSWNDIDFDTGAVFGKDDYGRLVLKY